MITTGGCAATAKGKAPPDLLIILPLDTAAVTYDDETPVDALATEEDNKRPARRAVTSPAVHIARVFHPAFGAAVAHAARRVEVIDSSAAAVPCDDPDWSRYRLIVETLHLSHATATVARRTVPPSPPGFDPATGMMTPGVRRAYTEGPGRMTTLKAVASWTLHDTRGEAPAARQNGDARDTVHVQVIAAGTATGTAVFRGDAGDARRTDWEAAARALALDVLAQTAFAPGGFPPPPHRDPAKPGKHSESRARISETEPLP